MAVLSGLKPEKVFHYFEEISKIPRPSYHEEEISDYLVRFARLHSLEYYTDDLHNVIMIKEASAGYENVEPIILQGHMDMVCEKEANCTKDMMTEGLDLEVNGDYISAKGTTLGGDDGIAVAFALAILDDDTIAHPRLEFVCTVSEEVGMDGAAGIDLSMLKGHKLLNLDSEEEGYILCSCAGGGTARVTLPVNRETCEDSVVEIEIAGLTGGHSGTEIHRGRASATMLLLRMLTSSMKKTGIRLLSLTGGSKDNAIPREAKASVAVSDEKLELLLKILEIERRAAVAEFSVTDSAMDIQVKISDEAGIAGEEIQVLTKRDTARVLALMNALPNGVIRMCDNMDGLTETSLNLGITSLEDEELVLGYSVRSSVASAYQALVTKLSFLSESLGAEISMHGEYPAWEFRKDSVLRDTAVATYREMFGKEPIVTTMHAGVECGLLSDKIKNLDAISIGPDLLDIHTPEERMSISSVQRMYDYVLKIISCK